MQYSRGHISEVEGRERGREREEEEGESQQAAFPLISCLQVPAMNFDPDCNQYGLDLKVSGR